MVSISIQQSSEQNITTVVHMCFLEIDMQRVYTSFLLIYNAHLYKTVHVLKVYIFLAYFTEGLAWDWVNEMLYWIDACDKDIEVFDPRTGYRKVLFQTGPDSDPRGIVVDPTTRYGNYLHMLIQ